MKFHKILLSIVFVFTSFFVILSHADQPHSQQLIVISDIDDTLKETNLHPGIHIGQFIKNVISSTKSFIGMDTLFSTLANRGAQFYYVSGAIKPIGFLPRRFLQESNFPPGEIVLRDRLNIGQEDYKYSEIKKIISTNPQAKFIFLGDNGEYDVRVFEKLIQDPDLKGVKGLYYVHKVFDEPTGSSIPADQMGYVTAGDLALSLYDLNILNKIELLNILDLVIRGLQSQFKSVRDRTLPFYNKLQDFNLMPLFNRLEIESDPVLKSKLEKLFDLILERKKNNSCNINLSF